MFTVTEDSIVGTTVGTISASDKDTQKAGTLHKCIRMQKHVQPYIYFIACIYRR